MLITFKDGQRNGAATTWLPNGKVAKQMNYQNGTPVGDLLEINTKGEIARTGTFEEGRKVVTKTNYFFNTKKKQSEIVYSAAKTIETTPDDYWTLKLAKYGAEGSDLRNGSYRTWYANGKPESDGAYVMGKKSGTFTYWHENGQVASTGEYKDDLAVGTWVWWYENGQKSAVGKYTNGNFIGDWRWWDETGKLTKQKTYNGTESASAEPTETQPTAAQPTEAQPTAAQPTEDKVDVSHRTPKNHTTRR
jgi:antitoxin component YwqK of YwqJK toxin-antitoxin module